MSISLQKSVRTCKVESGQANRIESDRFLNSDNMVCPVWTGYDLEGRRVAPDSFYTKSAGCNSAMDRVVVENCLRPQYSEYLNLNANALGLEYGDDNTTMWADSGEASAWEENRGNITGSFSNQFRATNTGSCGIDSYERAMAQMEESNRNVAYANNAFFQNDYRKAGGNGGSTCSR